MRGLDRLGSFKVSLHLVETEPEQVMVMMRSMVVLRAEVSYIAEAIEYHCYSPMFRRVNPGEPLPEYSMSMDSNKTVVAIEV